ncbi:MAG: sulfate reduction electron transfer complex DsrMKJOP subunit DsrM [Chloroflexi bacterium]|nr:sulfate reduction electron transfer complex DsrMKJOP subunit DsrM [Chloroflexota bacterium]
MKVLYALLAVIILALVPIVGVGELGLRYLFGVIIPYAAFAIFVVGLAYRIVRWARTPVPFNIPTTAGQQKSLPWIKASNVESPNSTLGVIARMALEILFFRSLLRQVKGELRGGELVYEGRPYLWVGGLLFHWAMLFIVVRHLLVFLRTPPDWVTSAYIVDAFLRRVIPTALQISTVIVLVAVAYLFLRRVVSPQLRYISLPSDYFAVLLFVAIFVTGALMQQVFVVPFTPVRSLLAGLITLSPRVPEIHPFFFVHFFLFNVLLAYFPFSKLMHAPGVFFSPTRNMRNDSRARRYINPWNYPVKVATYEDYENRFRKELKVAGLPLESEGGEAMKTPVKISLRGEGG